MDLSIDFVCPECNRIYQQKLIELAPGRPRRCPACGARPRLTDDSLKGLRRSLEEHFRP